MHTHTNGLIPMCSLVSKAVNEDPGGTAATHSCYVMVEVPLPWNSDVALSNHFPSGLRDEIKRLPAQGFKFKTLVYTSDANHSPAGYCRILFFWKPALPFARYDKLEYVVPTERAGAVVRAFLERTHADSFESTSDPLRALHPFEPFRQQSDGVRDLFVCTHGSHDACCGKFGYAAYHELDEVHAARSGGKLRAWRVSHIGGHRLAPTAIDFPEGRYWAHLTSEAIQSIADKQGPTDSLKKHIRGWGALTPCEQLVEREIFILEGWNWIQYEKSGSSQPQEDGGVRVRIDYHSSDHAVAGTYVAIVNETESIAVSGCGYESPQAYPQYKLSDFHKV